MLNILTGNANDVFYITVVKHVCTFCVHILLSSMCSTSMSQDLLLKLGFVGQASLVCKSRHCFFNLKNYFSSSLVEVMKEKYHKETLKFYKRRQIHLKAVDSPEATKLAQFVVTREMKNLSLNL